jgi:two-component sensor histidine kinase
MLQQVVGKRRIEWSVDDVDLPVKQGMSLAVLINELVNNAVKHGGQQIRLRLGVQEQMVTLEVTDDGPGFAEEFHPESAANFGLELVETVGRLDLGGTTAYENRPEGGARVRVTFPVPLAIPA